MISVKYPNSHGLDGLVHEMEIEKIYRLKSLDDVLLECKEGEGTVYLHLKKIDGKWVKIPHRSTYYMSGLITKGEDITDKLKREIDGLNIANKEELSYSFPHLGSDDSSLSTPPNDSSIAAAASGGSNPPTPPTPPADPTWPFTFIESIVIYEKDSFINQVLVIGRNEKNENVLKLYTTFEEVLDALIKIATQKGMLLDEMLEKDFVIKSSHPINIDEYTTGSRSVSSSSAPTKARRRSELSMDEKIRREEESKSDDTSDDVIEDTEDGKKQKRGLKTAITSLAIVAFLFTGGYIISRSGSRQMAKNSQRQEEQYTNPDPDYDTPTLVATEQPITSVTHDDNFTSRASSSNANSSYSQEELEETIAVINEATFVNIGDLTNFLIMGSRLNKADEHTLYFGEMFAKGTIDGDIVSAFCDERNEIVSEAFQGKNREEISRSIERMLDKFFGFILNGTTINNNGTSARFNDLSPLAQYVVFQFGQSMLETTHDYSFKINNKEYSYDQLLDLVMERFDVVTQNLYSHNHIGK